MSSTQRVLDVSERVAFAFPCRGGEYPEDVWRMLAGIAAVESNCRYRRQIGFAPTTPGGAFGLWQCEMPAIARGMSWLMTDAAAQAAAFQCLDPQWHWIVLAGHELNVSRLIQHEAGDTLACILARGYLMRLPEPVPRSVADQAALWKLRYNTPAGRGTVDRYLECYDTMVRPIWPEAVSDGC